MDENTQWMAELAEGIENNTGEFAVDLRENEIVANWRKGIISAGEAREQLDDLMLVQTEERWQEYLEEYKDEPKVIEFMNKYGYVPFSFELEEEPF